MTSATSIEEVIVQLEYILRQCIERNSRLGYFAALYHRVTCRVRDGIVNSEFDDNNRMERLDVLFANLYIEAWHQYQNKQKPSSSWKIAFDTAKNKGVIMQHLLLGINAHINLDLGLATARTMQGYSLYEIRKDYNTINAVLASMIDLVQDELLKVSPLLFLLDNFGKSFDEKLTQFSIVTAREGAWQFACELSGKTGTAHDDCINTRDKAIYNLGYRLANPRGNIFSGIIKMISWLEYKQPAKAIKIIQYVAKKSSR